MASPSGTLTFSIVSFWQLHIKINSQVILGYQLRLPNLKVFKLFPKRNSLALKPKVRVIQDLKQRYKRPLSILSTGPRYKTVTVTGHCQRKYIQQNASPYPGAQA